MFITAYGQFKLPHEFEKCLSLATLSWFGLKFVCTSPDLLAGSPVFALTHFAAQNSPTRGPSCFSGQVVSATEVHRKPSAGNSSPTSLTVDASLTVSRAENTQTGTRWKYGNSKFEKQKQKKQTHLNSCGSLASLLVVMFSSRDSYWCACVLFWVFSDFTKCAKGVDGWCDAFRRVEWQTSCVDSALVF